MVNASASGKVILMGEHAVVHGGPAMASPVRELSTIVTVLSSQVDDIRAYVDLSEKQKRMLKQLITLLKLELDIDEPLLIKIESSIPIGAGLGSSASLSVSLLRALLSYASMDLPDEKALAILHQAESLFHGDPSGLDHSTVWYEKTIYFQTKVIKPLDIRPSMLFIVPSSSVSDTKDVIATVKKQLATQPNETKAIFTSIFEQVEQGKDALISGNLETLGECMTNNHDLLKQLGVSNDELDALVERALDAGAYGAKMTGAGKGGHIIALCDQDKHDRLLHTFRNYSPIICVLE